MQASLLKLAAASALAAAASAQEAQLVMLPGSTAAGAVCLDGSPYGAYWAPGSGEGANKWALYFQGGG